MRHESSLVNHRSSKLYIKELESTSEGLKRGLNFAHRLLGNHHVRTGRRHKAAKGSLSLLKRQQIRARRQRLALKKQLRRAVAQQSLLERKMERLHHILDVVLQVSAVALPHMRYKVVVSPSVRPSFCLCTCVCVCAHTRQLHSAHHQSINQSINVLKCPGRQLGPNRQEVQFSESIQTRFASYMQSIPSGNHHMHLVHTKS